jgi:hypothetical protein
MPRNTAGHGTITVRKESYAVACFQVMICFNDVLNFGQGTSPDQFACKEEMFATKLPFQHLATRKQITTTDSIQMTNKSNH